MRQIPTSPFPSGGRNPVAEAVSSDQFNLYVVNQDDNSIVQFVIGNDGKVYPQNTVNTPGIYPMAVAVSGTNLYVVDTFQPLPICSNAEPCSGSIGVLPITVGSGSPPSDTLGPPLANGSLTYWPLASMAMSLPPTSRNAPPEPTSDVITPPRSTCSLRRVCLRDRLRLDGNSPTLAMCSPSRPVRAASLRSMAACHSRLEFQPSAIASDSTSSYLYVTDFNNGNVLGYSIASGPLTPLAGSPFPAGNQPSAIVADPKYPFFMWPTRWTIRFQPIP
jgi:6-phosphogluconolactonase